MDPDLERLLQLMVKLDPVEKNYDEWKFLISKLDKRLEKPVVFKDVGPRLHGAIIKMNIPMEDIPFVDGRVDVYKFLETWKKGMVNSDYKYFFEYFMDHAIQCDMPMCPCRASTFMDLICTPELRTHPKYNKEIEEILNRD